MFKTSLKTTTIRVIWILAFASVSHAQVLSTGETGGKDSQSMMISANAIQAKNFATLGNFWAQYGRGVGGRIDAFLGYGNLTVFGRSQSYLAVGSNVGLLRRTAAGVDVSLYNNAGIAVNHRQEASRILLTSALIASRPVKIRQHAVTAYGGLNRQTPIIRPINSVFTPPTPVYSGVAGLSMPAGAMTFFLELNPGSAQRSVGVGVLYGFPQDTGTGKSASTTQVAK